MITVRYDRARLTLSVMGHAGYAERGSDIVCAGASALWAVLAMHDKVTGTSDPEDGSGTLSCLPGCADTVMPIMDAVARVFREMARQYGDYVEYIEVGLS